MASDPPPNPPASILLAGTALDLNSKIPIYHQLYELLRARIVGGEWKAGDLVPPEAELMRHYQVSRITVRKALDMLVHENLIHRERGRGTFVNQPSLAGDATRLINFSDQMLWRGFLPSTRVLRTELFVASARTAEILDITAGDTLACIGLLQFADGEPIGVEDSFLPHSRCPEILDKFDFSQITVAAALEEGYGVRLSHATQRVTAMQATPILMEVLENAYNPVLLFIERIAYSQFNTALEFKRCYYRADRYALEYQMHA